MKKIAIIIVILLSVILYKHTEAGMCGNNITEPGEACDGADLNGYVCSTVAAGFVGGILSCKSDCSGYDVSRCIRGNTIIAASCSSSDVQAAIDKAVDGDTVIVPAGNCTWNSTLTLDKAVVLKGAGADLTVLNYGGNVSIIRIAPSSDKAIRVTGFSFHVQSNLIDTVNGWAITVVGNGKGSFGLTKIRIDHNTFNKGKRQIFWTGWAYGLVDNNIFKNGNIAIGICGDNNYSWQRPIVPGTSDSLFIEDNVFIINNDSDREPNEAIYHQEGGRSVTRYNIFNGSTYTNGNSLWFDSHGNWPCPPSGSSGPFDPDSPEAAFTCRGQPLIEVYGNTFSQHHSYRWAYLRGGTILFWNNTLTNLKSGLPSIEITDEESWQSLFFEPLKTVWPAHDQITNSYFWNNTINGVLINPRIKRSEDTIFIQENRDYFTRAPQPGDVYYPYSPYTYPHPFRTDCVSYPTLCDRGDTIFYGDISGDNQISAYDAALAAQYSVGLISLTQEQIQKAEVSGDKQVTAYDAALIAQRAVGLINKFPIEGLVFGLNININPVGAGTVNITPPKLSYNRNEQVILQVVPVAGYKFDSWSGSLTGSANPAIINMDANKTITANFSPIITPPVEPYPNSILDTITLNPSGAIAGTGYDLFGANTLSGKDYAFGFAFKVSKSLTISAVEFLAKQVEPGSNIRALLYKGRNIQGSSDLYYWLPHYSWVPEATFNLVTPLPGSNNTEPYLFRFQATTPYNLQPDTPYVIVFDPEPTSDNKGIYALPSIAAQEGFLSAEGTPNEDVVMPSFLVRRLLDVTKSYYYTQWSFSRTDRRYLVRLLK